MILKSKLQHNLFRFRWCIPILGEIHDQKGAKFVTLSKRLGISRSVLSSTLNYLVEKGLIIRNPGHGHPLRPEYILTLEGKKTALFCSRLMKQIKQRNAERLVHSRWALRILFLVNEIGVRFSELKTNLAPITSRSLSQELKMLLSEGYIRRKIIDDYPPATLYQATPKSSRLIMRLNNSESCLSE